MKIKKFFPLCAAEALDSRLSTLDAPLEARLMLAAPESGVGRFMYMPKGKFTITPSCYGKAVTVTVNVEPKAAAAALNAQLAEVNKNRAPQKVYFDFNHDKDRASFWPAKFEAGDDGVYVLGEFSASGKAAVEGKDYRGFSPLFFTDAEIPLKEIKSKLNDRIEIPAGKIGSADKPAQIVCNEFAGLNFGGLVNEPAFKEISPLWAKAAGEPSDEPQNEEIKTMKKTIAELQAAKATLETEIKALKAKADKTAEDMTQLAAKEKDLRIAELEAREADRRSTDAKDAVKRAVTRGALAAKNAELQAKWENECTENPALIGMLDAMQANSALTARATDGAAAAQLEAKEGPGRVLTALFALAAKNKGVGKGRQILTGDDVLQKADISRQMSALYAKDIAKNNDVLNMSLAAIGQLPLEGATNEDTLGTLSGTLVVQRCLEFFRLNYPLFKAIFTDFSDQPAMLSQTINTRIISRLAVQTYNKTLAASGYPLGWNTASAGTTTDVNITLDEHVGVPVVFGADALMKTVRRLFDEQSPAMADALAQYFVAKVYALFTALNYNGYAAVTAAETDGYIAVPTAYATYAKGLVDFGRSAAVDLNAIFNKNRVPMHDRFLLLNSDYFAAAGKDPSLVTFWAGQRNPELITDGELPRMSKFTPIEASNFPSTNNRVGVALQKNGVIAASRIPVDYTKVLPGASYGNVNMITDPETGLSVMLVEYVNHDGGYAVRRMETVIGAGVGDKRAGLLLTSQ